MKQEIEVNELTEDLATNVTIAENTVIESMNISNTISPLSPVPDVPEKEEAAVLISRLLQEMQQLRQENRKLSLEVDAERHQKDSLLAAKNALTAEIEELTKTLFEEANGMVAVEAQARWNLEQAQSRLEAELQKTRDLLSLECEQTKLLRGIVEEEKQTKRSSDPVLWDIDVFGARLKDSYYDDFFQDRTFDCRARSSVTHWERLSTLTVESAPFRLFSTFIDECFRISLALNQRSKDLADESVMAVLGHPFMRACLQADIEPCLAFPVLEKAGKLKSMLKKLLPALLKNTCLIEPLPNQSQSSNMQSPNSVQSPLLSPESIRASPLSIRSFISIAAPPVARSKTSSPIKIPGSNNTNTASNFDSFLGSSPTSITSIESCPVSPSSASSSSSVSLLKCSLCDCPGSKATHRFKISASPISSPTKSPQWNLICKSCRDRLVSVASFFTILRHLIQGLHAHRPKLDVYYDFMQAKRYMFYTRAGVDPAFYAISDFEAFSKKISEL